jgi:hypothetical protein
MAKIYLGSSSSLGTVVLSVDDEGTVRVLGGYTPDMEACRPLIWWGRGGPGVRNLARVLVQDATGCTYGENVVALVPLIRRLEALMPHCWFATDGQLLAGLSVIQ